MDEFAVYGKLKDGPWRELHRGPTESECERWARERMQKTTAWTYQVSPAATPAKIGPGSGQDRRPIERRKRRG